MIRLLIVEVDVGVLHARARIDPILYQLLQGLCTGRVKPKFS